MANTVNDKNRIGFVSLINPGKGTVRVIMILAIYTFLYMCTSSFATELHLGRPYYIANLLLTGIGFVIYALGVKCLKKIENKIFRILSAVYLFLLIFVGLWGKVFICGLSLLNGILGGYSYDLLRLLPGGKRGRCLAYGGSLAIFMEYVMAVGLSASERSFSLTLLFMAGALLLLNITGLAPTVSETKNDLAYFRQMEEGEKRRIIRRILGIGVAVVALYLLGNYMDGYLFNEQQVNEEAILHIHFYKMAGVMPAYLVMGYLWDFQKKVKFTSVLTVAIAVIALLWPIYFLLTEFWSLPFYMEFIMAGVILSFANLEYLEISASVHDGEWIAGFGRLLDCVMTAAMAYFDFTFWPTLYVQIFFILAVFALILIMIPLGEFVVRNDAEPIVLPPKGSGNLLAQEYLDLFSETYQLTDREKEVLIRMLSTEETGQEMANALFISRRVLVKHTSAIYEKTGSSGRIGLVQNYYNFAAKHM